MANKKADKEFSNIIRTLQLRPPNVAGLSNQTGTDTDESNFENAKVQYNVKYSAIKKGYEERSRSGQQSSQAMDEDRETQIVYDLREDVLRLREQEEGMINDMHLCQIHGLPKFVHEPLPVIPLVSDLDKEAQKMDETSCFQARLLQRLCLQIDLPSDKQEYVDKLCNSVLTGAYDFLR